MEDISMEIDFAVSCRILVLLLFFNFLLQLANIMGHFQWLTCPRKDLSIGWLHCDPGPLFRPEYFSLPALMHQWDFGDSIPGHGGITDRMDCQVSCWSSTYLLNSSALPRQFVYLVVNLFPRCIVLQMVMAVFAYIYHQSFVMPPSFSLEMFLDQVSWFHTFLYLFCFLVFY
ncbi:hypothetical protein GW17_00038489 [Ensete ventricosum]|nr:hypothetical protein GW17_00038489 [Ensete ventricosum]